MTNWHPGDRALCIDKYANRPAPGYIGTQWPKGTGPIYGTIYLVSELDSRDWLGLVGEDPEFSWDPRGFRKVVPACDAVANEQEIAL